MSITAATVALVFAAASTPLEVREDLDAHPWRPAPASLSSSEAAAPAAGKPGIETAKASAREVAPAASSGPGSWQLQLGAFQSPDAAQSEKKRLEKILGPGTVEILQDGSMRKLRYGNFPSKLEAESARTTLKAKGVEGVPAPHP